MNNKDDMGWIKWSEYNVKSPTDIVVVKWNIVEWKYKVGDWSEYEMKMCVDWSDKRVLIWSDNIMEW